MSDDISKVVTAAVQAALAPWMQQWGEQDRRASDSRGKMFDGLAALQQEVAKHSVHVGNAVAAVDKVEAQLAAFEPRLRAVEGFRNGVAGEQRGAGKVMARLRGVLTLALAAGSMIVAALSYFGQHK